MSENDNSMNQSLSPAKLKKMLHKQALAELNENLNVNERAMVVIEGLSGQAMIATNQQRVLVFKRGFMGGIAFGRRLYAWHFSQIQGVRVDVRLLKGFVALELIESNVDALTYWGNGDDDVWSVGNAIPMDVSKEKEVREGAKALRLMLHESRQPVSTPVIKEPAPRAQPLSTPLTLEQSPEEQHDGEISAVRFCFNCGAQLRRVGAFCESCGQKLF